MERHYDRAWRVAFGITGYREDADDATQEAFERALRRLDDFDTSRPFGPWVHRIAANCAVDIIRRRRHDGPAPIPDTIAEHRTAAAGTTLSVEVVAAVQRLPFDQRAVVILRLYAGFTPAETAAILDIEVGTVHSRLSRGRSHLRQQLGEPE